MTFIPTEKKNDEPSGVGDGETVRAPACVPSSRAQWLCWKTQVSKSATACGTRSSAVIVRRSYLDMERRWLSLARSYQFSESFHVFCKHNKKRHDEATGNR
jgi:hypothetical protein